MNITQFSIEKNRITFISLLTIIVLGLVLYQSLPRDSMPPYTVRVATVVSSFPGADPARVELLVSDKIEKVAQELPELKDVTSTSRTGLSVVSVTLKDEVSPENLQAVWDNLRRKLGSIRGLPQGVQPDLKDDGVGDVYGIVVGLTSDGIPYPMMKDYADDLRNEVIKLPDAAKVELGGVQEERIFVAYNDATLKEYGLTSSKLQGVLGAVNVLSSAGAVNLDSERIILEPTGNFTTIEDLKKTLIPVGNGSQVVYLEDITTITRGFVDPPEQIIKVNGKDAISLHINLKKGANIIKLGGEVDAVMAEWQEKLPYGLELTRLSSLDHYIDNKIESFVENLMQSIGIVLLVMLVFLGVRTGSIIASLIPIVTIMTLMLMGLMGIGLNQVTLAALIMALGMMVDNAIVVAESIMVKMEEGVPAKQAAVDSCTELFGPLLISTLTTSAAFMAFYLAESIMGDIVGPIFVVISLALLSSWFMALTVITLFCYLFLKIKPAAERKPSLVDRVINWLKKYYKQLMLTALRFKYLMVVIVIALFAAAIYGFGKVNFVFFPDSDRNMITLDVDLPLGTRIEETMATIQKVEKYIADSLQVHDASEMGIIDWSSYIGKGPESYDLGYSPGEANSSYAHLLINTSNAAANNAMVERIDNFCFMNFPDAIFKVGALGAGGGGVPVEVEVAGNDPDELFAIATSVKKKLSAINGTKNISDSWGAKSKKFVIKIDQDKAQKAGISNQDIATSLRTVLDGFQAGEFREDDQSIPIIMRSEGGQQKSLAALETMSVYGQNNGRNVPLIQVAEIIPQWLYPKIKRKNLRKSISISSKLTANGNASKVVAELKPWIEEQSQNWSPNTVYEFGGDDKSTAENMGAVIAYLPLAGFIIILLLIVQFNSIRKTAMVVMTIPLGIIGVVIGLLSFNEPFGFMPFLGVISLAGIVINNAIVLIDRIEIEQNEFKRSDQDAVVMACLQRFRPILLATFTTVLGLIPLYLSGGEMWEGMAVSIMVGLLFGTVITLLFIPALFSILFRVSFNDYGSKS